MLPILNSDVIGPLLLPAAHEIFPADDNRRERRRVMGVTVRRGAKEGGTGAGGRGQGS